MDQQRQSPLNWFQMFCVGSIIGVSLCLLNPNSWAASNTDTSLSSPVTVSVLKASLAKTDYAQLNLKQALEIAEESNAALQAEGEVTRQVKKQYQTKIAELIPDVELDYTNSNYEGALQIFGNNSVNVTREINQPSIIFRFPVFKRGVKWFSMFSAKHTYKAQQAKESATNQQTLQQTALRYYDLQRRLAEIAIAKKQLEESQIQMNMNNARLEAGVGTQLDVLQSKAQLARARQASLEAMKNAQIAAAWLNEMLDLDSMVEVIPTEPDQALNALVPEGKGFQDLVKLAYENRKELVALAKQIDAIESLRKIFWTGLLPEANFEIQTGGVGPALNRTRNFDRNAFSLILKFQNLYVSALTRYKEKGAQLKELHHRINAQMNTIEREVTEAYLQAMTQKAQIDVVKEEIEASEQALGNAIERLKVGVGRNIDVVDAETQLTQARKNLNIAITAFNQAQVNLVSAIGLTSIQTLTQGINSQGITP